jgi:U2-associated protein SR140
MKEALKTYNSLDSQSQADGFKHRIMQIFRAWEEWDIYPKEFLFRCQNTFLGLSINEVNIIKPILFGPLIKQNLVLCENL